MCYTDINMGIGIVSGLGSVMIGEIVLKLFHIHSIPIHLLKVIGGVFCSDYSCIYP